MRSCCGPPAVVAQDQLSLASLKGLGAGGLLGVAIGLTFPVDANDCGPDSATLCSSSEALLGGTIGFGTIGLMVGGLVKSEQWAPITLGSRPEPSTTRRPFGFQMAVRLHF